MKNPLYQLAQVEAVGRICAIYACLQKEPISAESVSATEEALTNAVKLIDAKRTRALVIIALQDPDPASLPEGTDPTDYIKHTSIGCGHLSLMKALCVERVAGLELASDGDFSGSKAFAGTLAELGLDPGEFVDHLVMPKTPEH